MGQPVPLEEADLMGAKIQESFRRFLGAEGDTSGPVAKLLAERAAEKAKRG